MINFGNRLLTTQNIADMTVETKQDGNFLSIIIKDNGKTVKEVVSNAEGWLQLFNSSEFGKLFGR